MRKILCSVVVLAMAAGTLAAADSKPTIKMEKSYPALVLKLDQAKHTMLIQFSGPNGKMIQKAVIVPGTVKFGDIHCGTRYTFVERAGKVIAVRPMPVPAVARKSLAPAAPQAVTPVVPPTPALKAAQVTARQTRQEEVAAAAVLRQKTAAAQVASAKARAAQKSVAQTDKALAAATQVLKAQQVTTQVTAFRAAQAQAVVVRAEAQAKVAEAQAALAKAEAARALALVQVAKAQAALAQVDATQAVQAKTRTAQFVKTLTILVRQMRQQYAHAYAAVVKARQEQRVAQQFEKQKAVAAGRAAARVNQIRTEEEKARRTKLSKVAVKHVP